MMAGVVDPLDTHAIMNKVLDPGHVHFGENKSRQLTNKMHLDSLGHVPRNPIQAHLRVNRYSPRAHRWVYGTLLVYHPSGTVRISGMYGLGLIIILNTATSRQFHRPASPPSFSGSSLPHRRIRKLGSNLPSSHTILWSWDPRAKEFVNEGFQVGGPLLCALLVVTMPLQAATPELSHLIQETPLLIRDTITILSWYGVHNPDVDVFARQSQLCPKPVPLPTILVLARCHHLDNRWLDATSKIHKLLLLQGFQNIQVEIADKRGLQTPTCYPINKADAIYLIWEEVCQKKIIQSSNLEQWVALVCLRFGCVENPSQNPTAVVLSVNPALSSNLCSIRAIRSQQRRHMEPETTCSVYLVTIPSQRSFIIIYPLFSAIRQGRRSSGKGLDMKLHHYQKKIRQTTSEFYIIYLQSFASLPTIAETMLGGASSSLRSESRTRLTRRQPFYAELDTLDKGGHYVKLGRSTGVLLFSIHPARETIVWNTIP